MVRCGLATHGPPIIKNFLRDLPKTEEYYKLCFEVEISFKGISDQFQNNPEKFRAKELKSEVGKLQKFSSLVFLILQGGLREVEKRKQNRNPGDQISFVFGDIWEVKNN